MAYFTIHRVHIELSIFIIYVNNTVRINVASLSIH